ncbi:Hypothetical protein, putative [Bodo saltans]|uniref:GRIP domain-containing protein n=1 Tax=Bodo saltans TaxID=75058 RepID=A0A0S4JVC5_BODSA|nr:Hypothetical protein, putative [Bodo saltans]|eukprot:CUG94174.1 Hypothetical protein, putative [Bodo saltans]
MDKKVALWREKVRAVKDADEQRIAEKELEISRLKEVNDNSLRDGSMVDELRNALRLTEARFDECVEKLEHEREQSLEVHKRSEHDLSARLAESDERCDLLRKELKRLRDQLSMRDERCDLLRKELKRLRDQLSMRPEAVTTPTTSVAPTGLRDASSTLSLTVSLVGGGGVAAPVPSPSPAVSGNPSALLRAAAGGVFETDMVSFASLQSNRDGEIRQLNDKIAELERAISRMTSDSTHHEKMVTQLTKELEAYKAKERMALSMEYIRNVILSFLCTTNEDSRLRIIPAIATILEFTEAEKETLQRRLPGCPRLH